MKKRRWLWVLLFILGLTLLAALAAGWNLVLVYDHLSLVDLSERLQLPENSRGNPWLLVTLGSLGFLTAIVGLIIFFVKILREMRLNQAQSEFLATVTHELKTPIATIELCSSLLRLEPSKDEADKLWDSFEHDLKRLKEQVETLLEAARWQADERRIERRRIQLEEWIEAAFKRWSTILGPDASLERSGDRLEATAWIDPKALDLITDNLVDNARKFAKGPARVRVITKLAKKKWAICFEDHGWGFHPNESEKIFKRFARGQPVAPHSVPGTGLGLFLASTASKALRLRLSGSSAGLGKGAQFTLEGKTER